jgi:hypothetical protein
MKKILLLSAAMVLAASVASAQDIDTPAFGDPTAKSSMSLSKVVNVYLETPLDKSSPALIEAIAKELNRSNNIDLVTSPIEAAQLVAPTKIIMPKDGKTEMKVSYQFNFWRGSEQDLSVSCAVSKPQDCAKAIRTRVDRLVREME